MSQQKNLLSLYQIRLQNLTQTIQNLHNIVSNDQILPTLSSQSLHQYRIDRIHELVQQILNNEKQKLLIRALQKYQELSINYQIQIKSNQENQQRFIRDKQKDQKQKQRLRSEVMSLRGKQDQRGKEDQRREDQREQVIKLRREIENQRNQMMRKQEKMKTELLREHMREHNHEECLQIINKLKSDGKQAINILKNENIALRNKIEEISRANIEQGEQICKLKQQAAEKVTPASCSHQRQEHIIQSLKNKIKHLEDELIHIQKQFAMIKDCVIGRMGKEITKLRRGYVKWREDLKRELEEYRKYEMKTGERVGEKVVMMLQKMAIENAASSKMEDKFVRKINQIDNQLDYFIENEII